MINLLNKILSRFHLKLVSTKPVDLVKESVKFLNTIPSKDFLEYLMQMVDDIATGKEEVIPMNDVMENLKKWCEEENDEVE